MVKRAPRPAQAFIAKALGLSEAAITKCKRLGMPLHSVDAARAWRKANIRAMVTSKTAGSDEIDALQALWPVARAALQAGRPDLVLPTLQAAMRAVPEDERHLVDLDGAVMDALCRPMAEKILAGEQALVARLSDHDAEAMGAFWYSFAAGEPDPYRWLDGEPAERGHAAA